MNILNVDYSLEIFWDELVFVSARLEAEPSVKHLAPPVNEHLAKYERLASAGRELRRSGVLTKAQAKTAEARVEAHLVEVSSATLYEVKQQRKDLRYSMLFKMNMSEFARLNFTALKDEVLQMKTVLKLSQYSDTFRDAQNQVLDQIVSEIDTSLENQKAIDERELFHRVEVKAWKDMANTIRLAVYGELVQMPGVRSKAWARSFFLPPKTKKKLSAEEKARLEAERIERKKKKIAKNLEKVDLDAQKAQDKLAREKAKSLIDGNGKTGPNNLPEPLPPSAPPSGGNGAAPPAPVLFNEPANQPGDAP